jgi:hypothetical protein
VEQPLGRRHRQQRADLAAAARLAEDRHVARIAAEARGVVAHPLQRSDDVQHADVAGVGELGAGAAQIEMPVDRQPVIDADDHHVAGPRQIRAVVAERRPGAVGIAAAVNPHHHGTLPAVVDDARGRGGPPRPARREASSSAPIAPQGGDTCGDEWPF